MLNVQQKINGNWKTIQSPFTPKIAVEELVMLTAANPGTDFRIETGTPSKLDVLHLDSAKGFNAHAEQFYVLCSCNAVFTYSDPDGAASLHGDHVEDVMPDPAEFDMNPLGAARRAAQSIRMSSGILADSEPDDSITSAIVDLLLLAEISKTGDSDSAPAILDRAVSLYTTERGAI